jgi:glutaminyl-peptide cyclotransferase
MRHPLLLLVYSHFLLASSSVIQYSYTTLNTIQHPKPIMIQGFEFIDETRYLATIGHYGSSRLTRVDLRTGKSEEVGLGESVLGTGVTSVDGYVLVSTYKESKLLIFKASSLDLLAEIRTPVKTTPGLANDGSSLYITDGSDAVVVADLRALLAKHVFTVTRVLKVRQGLNRWITSLSEIEVIEGELWANLHYSATLVKVNTMTGSVTGWLDLSSLVGSSNLSDDILHGISAAAPISGRTTSYIDYLQSGASDSTRCDTRVYVTGRRWTGIYEILVTPGNRIHHIPLN